MRSILVFLMLCCFSGLVPAQEAHSLLWEISGNGLKKSSYLYGTMHVSKKIAFRLDDVFFEALYKSDIVALESDPGTWLDQEAEEVYSSRGQRYGLETKGFYVYPFQMKALQKEHITEILSYEDRLLNGIMYRSDGYSQNFEEETYLDMFLYQAGKKFKKPVIALEDLEESQVLAGRAALNPVRAKPAEWLQKRMQHQDLLSIMQDAYRQRNINLLDSIDQAMYSEYYLQNMLHHRNKNMVDRLATTMKKGSVFTGIGAAHLPGKKGVISLLRLKGYKVTALQSAKTLKGIKIKQKLLEKELEVPLIKQEPDDGFFSISLPNKLYPIVESSYTTYIAPDLVNGSYIMVNRIPSFSYLHPKNKISISQIDPLLFESIPGTIISKKPITKQGIKGLDILNKLKNGDYQRYQIYLTPLEIIIFKMGGEGNYVKSHSNAIFNSLKFKKDELKAEVIKSPFQDFKIEMPGLYRFTNANRKGERLLEGVNTKTDDYYFLRKVSLSDYTFIEEDAFELKQIQKRFFRAFKLTPIYGNVKNRSLVSSAPWQEDQNKRLYLKSTLLGSNYYLLGTLTEKPEKAAAFFSSFSSGLAKEQKAFVSIKDTALYFKTRSTVKPRRFVENSSYYYGSSKKPKAYKGYTKTAVYQNNTNEAVGVTINKSHDLLSLPSIDSVWGLRKKLYKDKKLIIQKEKSWRNAKGYYELELILADTASSRTIWVKNIAKGGLLYELKAVRDSIAGPSEFVREFFNSFQPQDTLIGRSILEDKSSDFFAALRKKDSIAFSGYRFVHFNNSHIDSLSYYISNFPLGIKHRHIQAEMIAKLSKIKDPRVIPFLRDFYGKSYNNSEAQLRILQAVTTAPDQASVDLLLELMDKDLPLTNNVLGIAAVFSPFEKKPLLAKKLYPKLLEYSSIEEYKAPIFSLLASLEEEGHLKPKLYKKYKAQMLNDSKLLLKRLLAMEQRSFGGSFNKRRQIYIREVLEDYMVLLYPYYHDKKVMAFFNKVPLSSDANLKTTYVSLAASEGNSLPYSMIDSLAKNIESSALLYRKLKKAEKSNMFPYNYATQKKIAASVLFETKKLKPEKDKIAYLGTRFLTKGTKDYKAYYFKHSEIQKSTTNPELYVLVFKNSNTIETTAFYKNKGLELNDTISDEMAIEMATETFLYNNRKRAIVYRPDRFYNGGF